VITHLKITDMWLEDVEKSSSSGVEETHA